MSRYTVGVVRDFIAQHFLIGGDWGRENLLHAHPYEMEAIFEGDELDRHQYLLDIAEVKVALDGLIDRFADKVLNQLPEFADKNPSLELFARILAEGLARSIGTGSLTALTVKLWENDEAFACHRLTFG